MNRKERRAQERAVQKERERNARKAKQAPGETYHFTPEDCAQIWRERSNGECIFHKVPAVRIGVWFQADPKAHRIMYGLCAACMTRVDREGSAWVEEFLAPRAEALLQPVPRYCVVKGGQA